MKKIIAFFLAFCVLISITGCTEETPPELKKPSDSGVQTTDNIKAQDVEAALPSVSDEADKNEPSQTNSDASAANDASQPEAIEEAVLVDKME